MGKVLIITTSGGSGHLQCAAAKMLEIQRKDKDASFIYVDILRAWHSPIGFMGALLYKFLQVRAWIGCLERLAKLSELATFIFWPKIFVIACIALFFRKAERVIDTQPLCSSATIKAIRLCNYFFKTRIMLEKFFADMPTDQNRHYGKNIKRLSAADKKLLRIISPKPLLDKHASEEAFWQDFCGVGLKNVDNEFFVREGFKAYMEKKAPVKPFNVHIVEKDKRRKACLRRILEKGSSCYRENDGCFDFAIEPESLMLTMVLGTFPGFKAQKSYVDRIISHCNEDKKSFILFLYCNDEMRAWLLAVVNRATYPANLTIVAFSHQDDQVLGNLYFKSDVTITRSGGQTTQELLCTRKGRVYIHSEAAKDENPLKGIAFWEAGNARYLIKYLNGKIITPSILSELLQDRSSFSSQSETIYNSAAAPDLLQIQPHTT